MHILHITFMYPSEQRKNHGKAVQSVVHAMSKAFPQSRHTILHLHSSIDHVTAIEDISPSIGIIRRKVSRFRRFFHTGSPKWFATLLKEGDYTGIHLHNLFPGAYWLPRKLEIPLVITLRGSDLKVVSLSYRRKKLRHLLLTSKAICSPCPKLAFRIFDKLMISYSRLSAIPNSIDVHWYERAEAKQYKKGEVLKIVCLSSIEPRKNIIATIKAVIWLKEQGLDVSLDIWGPIVNGKYGRKVKSLSTNIICYRGKLEAADEVKDVLDNAHIMLLCALKETFGIAYIEAIARKRPIIFNKEAGFTSFINSGKVGTAVTPTLSAKNIAYAIREILDNYDDYDFTGSEVFSDTQVKLMWQKIYSASFAS